VFPNNLLDNVLFILKEHNTVHIKEQLYFPLNRDKSSKFKCPEFKSEIENILSPTFFKRRETK
jgi:hypothetical protein